MKHYILKAHGSLRHLQWLRIEPVGHFGRAIEDFKHLFDIRHRLLDFAVNHAHEIQRLI